ncbi:MAG: hypothetical protein AAFN78_19655 [Pseudomonadota bacterium]
MALSATLSALAAAALPHPARSRPYPDSRYRRASAELGCKPGLQPLRHDLHAFVSARMRPEALAKVCGPMLLMSPKLLSLPAVLVLALAVPALVYAGFLMSALPDFLASTHRWLASAAVDRAALAQLFRRALWPRFAVVTTGLTLFLAISTASASAGLLAFGALLLLVLLLEGFLYSGLGARK